MAPSFWLFAALPPFLVALGVTGLLRARVGRKLGPRLAELGPALGFLAGFVGIVQGVPFLNNTPHHRVGEAAVLALAAALGFALLAPGPRLGRYAALAAAVLAIYWQLPGGQLPAEQWLLAGAAALLAVLVLDRLVLLTRTGAAALLVLAIAALGLAAIAVFAHAGLLGGMALALAAACAGWLVWARPFGKAAPGLAAAVGGGMVFAALGFATLEGAARTPWALAPLLGCFWAEPILRRLPVLARLGRKKPQRPLALAAAAALPALAAVALGAVL